MSVDYSACLGYGYIVPSEKIHTHPEDFDYEHPDSELNYECWEKLNCYDSASDWFCGDILEYTEYYDVIPTTDFYAFDHYAAVANQQLAAYGLKPSDCVKEKPSFIVFLKMW